MTVLRRGFPAGLSACLAAALAAAWQTALTSEGVPYTLVTASCSAPSETVNLPALSSGGTGNFNGVVIADSPVDYASGQLAALDSYESSFGVRQVDGSMFPSPALGVTDATGGSLDGSTATLTSAGLAAFGELKGLVPFGQRPYGRLGRHGHEGDHVELVAGHPADELVAPDADAAKCERISTPSVV